MQEILDMNPYIPAHSSQIAVEGNISYIGSPMEGIAILRLCHELDSSQGRGLFKMNER